MSHDFENMKWQCDSCNKMNVERAMFLCKECRKKEAGFREFLKSKEKR